jgi:hypothetical protein
LAFLLTSTVVVTWASLVAALWAQPDEQHPLLVAARQAVEQQQQQQQQQPQRQSGEEAEAAAADDSIVRMLNSGMEAQRANLPSYLQPAPKPTVAPTGSPVEVPAWLSKMEARAQSMTRWLFPVMRLQMRDHDELRTWHTFDSKASFDPTLLPNAAADATRGTGAASMTSSSSSSAAAAETSASAPPNELSGTPSNNRLELWTLLPDTSLGMGQMHVVGRDANAALPSRPMHRRTVDGRYVVQTDSSAAAAALASHTALPPRWEALRIELLFPHAQPSPRAFVFTPSTTNNGGGWKVDSLSGSDCPPANALAQEDSTSAHLRGVIAREVRATLSALAPNTWWKALPYAAAGGWALLRLRSRRFSPAQDHFSKRFVRALRNHPVVRQQLQLADPPPNAKRLFGVEVGLGVGGGGAQQPFLSATRERSEFPAWSTAQLLSASPARAAMMNLGDPSRLHQHWRLRSDSSNRAARVEIEARHVQMRALGGWLNWGRWHIEHCALTTEHDGKRVTITDLQVK